MDLEINKISNILSLKNISDVERNKLYNEQSDLVFNTYYKKYLDWHLESLQCNNLPAFMKDKKLEELSIDNLITLIKIFKLLKDFFYNIESSTDYLQNNKILKTIKKIFKLKNPIDSL